MEDGPVVVLRLPERCAARIMVPDVCDNVVEVMTIGDRKTLASNAPSAGRPYPSEAGSCVFPVMTRAEALRVTGKPGSEGVAHDVIPVAPRFHERNDVDRGAGSQEKSPGC